MPKQSLYFEIDANYNMRQNKDYRILIIYQFVIKKIMNQYSLQSKLGQGAFSVVYKVKRKEDCIDYAMKKMRIMSFSDKEISNCLNEVRILASIDDNNIVGYKDSFFDELTNTFCIVTEFLQGGDLSHIISKHKNLKKSVSEGLIWQVARHALQGLRTLHKMKILHRDIKSANIFLTKDQKTAKLGDMNVSIVSSNGMARTQTGTPYYASPEVWNEKPYSSKCDIWSLGVVLYQMATLRPPFMSNQMRTLKRVIMNGVYKKIPSTYSPELDTLIKMCLRVDPKDRPSADDILQDEMFEKYLGGKRNESDLKNESLLQKIQAPKKREFRIIKDRLPRNRFSSEKTLTNNSYMSEKQKEKQNIHTNKSLVDEMKKIKQGNLPSLKRPSSASSKEMLQKESRQVGIIQPREKPPLPKNRALRY